MTEIMDVGPMKFVQALRLALDRSGRSVKSVAEDSGVPYERLKQVARGRTTSTNADDAYRIAQAFGLSFEAFMRGDVSAADSHIRLREAREQAGFESAEIAALKFSWPDATYQAHEDGRNCIKNNHAVKYGRAFHVSPEWILFGTNEPTRKTVPVVGSVGDRSEVSFEKNELGNVTEITSPPGVSEKAQAVAVIGDAMWPRYSDGDVLVYDGIVDLSIIDGKECIVGLKDGRSFVKTVRAVSDGFDLESWNSPPIRSVEIEWAAEIIWVRRA